MNSNFKKNGFLVVRNYLDQIGLDINVLQEYFYLKGLTTKVKDDPQTPGSVNYYSDLLTETILKISKSKFEKFTGYNLLPTYSFSRLYLKGNKLTKHTDRMSAEISGTLCIDYSGKHHSEIYMSPTDKESDATKVILNPGDLCVYNGIKMWHWRDRVKNDWLLHTFLHYVDADGDKKHLVYDQRSYLGMPSINDKQFNQGHVSNYFKSYISNAYRQLP